MVSVDDVVGELSQLPVFDSVEDRRRTECPTCSRPPVACWCWALPRPRLEVRSTVVILQHPFEQKRALRTAPMIQHGLAPGKCVLFQGKRFSLNSVSSSSHDGRHLELGAILSNGQHSILLYPGANARHLSQLSPIHWQHHPCSYNIVLLDGTWRHARSIYHGSPCLHHLDKVEIGGGRCSSYVVRTQPSENCLSTVEAAAECLQHVEARPVVARLLVAPLHALCAVQLQHGAAPHDTKHVQQQRAQEFVKITAVTRCRDTITRRRCTGVVL